MSEEEPFELVRLSVGENFALDNRFPSRQPPIEHAVHNDIRDSLMIGVDTRSGRREHEARFVETNPTSDLRSRVATDVRRDAGSGRSANVVRTLMKICTDAGRRPVLDNGNSPAT